MRSSSGVRLTGSSVNSGGKFVKSRSFSNLGWNGGMTCFCSNWKTQSRSVSQRCGEWSSTDLPSPSRLFWRIGDWRCLRNRCRVGSRVALTAVYWENLSEPTRPWRWVSVECELPFLEWLERESLRSSARKTMSGCSVAFETDTNWVLVRHSRCRRCQTDSSRTASRTAVHPTPTSPR